jgi:hypothetical protein
LTDVLALAALACAEAGRDTDLQPTADEVANRVVQGADHEAILWDDDGRGFRLTLRKLIPTSGRRRTDVAKVRRRFTNLFERTLAERLRAWKRTGSQRWTR